MKQQVNLFNALPKREAVQLPFSQIVMINLIFIIVLSGIYGWGYLKNYKLKQAIQVVKVKQDKIRIVLINISKKYPTQLRAGKSLRSVVTALDKEVQLKTRIVSALSKKSASNVQGFSRYLESLSKNIVPNVWLKKIELKAGGTLVVLNGRAFQTSDVLKFLKSLSQDALFKNQPLKLTQLKHQKKSVKKEEGKKGKEQAQAQEKPAIETISFVLRTKVKGNK